MISNQRVIDTWFFKKTWRTLNCSPKTFSVIRENQENLICVGRRRELLTKTNAETMCFLSKAVLLLKAKHIVSCCKKVSSEIQSRHDKVVNAILNNILIQRGLVSHEQKCEDRNG